MDDLQVPIARALNRLLESETWARDRLAPFAAQTVEFRAPALPGIRFTLTESGGVEPAQTAAAATLTVTLTSGALWSLPQGIDHALRRIEISGNQELAAEILFLARHLRWDIEEELSRVFGDATAHRMVAEAKDFAAAAAGTAERFLQALMEYAIEERAMLASREEHDELARDNARLRDGIDRLDKRLERLGDG